MAKTGSKPDLGERIHPPLSSCSVNFWVDDNGRNTLKGILGDPDNPAVLTDAFIVNGLNRTLKAVEDFNKILPTLLPEEQDRLNALITENPLLVKTLPLESADDTLQRSFNAVPVYTLGRRGGAFRRQVLKNTFPVKG